MNKFKAGDKVKRIGKPFGSVKVGDIETVETVRGNGSIELVDHFYVYDPKYFELVQDENVMYLKKNWSLNINSENAEAYKQTLIALGYNWNQYCRGWRGQSFIRSDEANSNKVLFSNMTEDDHFEDIEEFLKFHFLPQKTESQLKLEELQKIIEDAQNKIEQLKQMK
jgi:hypothetical protein